MDVNKRVVVPGKLISTTATPVYFPSVIPAEKTESEVFWVKQLLYRLAYFADKKYNVYSNDDDSNGNHDVIIEIHENQKVEQAGVQVTELTRELQRNLTPKRDNYLEKIITELKKNNTSSPEKIVIGILFSQLDLNSGRPKLPKPKVIAKLIEKKLETYNGTVEKLEPTDFGQISISSINNADFCVPHTNNIGINISFDELPRTFQMYIEATDCIIKKKSKSLSPVLVIWSTSLERDKHWVMNDLVNYMVKQFENSSFSNVYLIESVDGDG